MIRQVVLAHVILVPQILNTSLYQVLKMILLFLPGVVPRESIERFPQNVPYVPIDGISLHNEENVQKWKYVVQRRITDEKFFFDQTVSCLEIMEFTMPDF